MLEATANCQPLADCGVETVGGESMIWMVSPQLVLLETTLGWIYTGNLPIEDGLI